MTDFFEVDFLPVETKKSGDAIALRYSEAGQTGVHVVDGGYLETGEALVKHIHRYYGEDAIIDRVILTHPDGDHARGLRTVLETMQVRELWMLRPWMYAEELLPKFARFQSAEALRVRLREIYDNPAALEDIALAKGIAIREPFQGASIGSFKVLAPSRPRYLELVVESERTPAIRESVEASVVDKALDFIEATARKFVNFVKAAWGDEVFSPNATSAENEMSVVQIATLSGKTMLLTGDAGRDALAEAADEAVRIDYVLPGVDYIQVPHHGSRRNVSTELLDRWLGERLQAPLPVGKHRFTAVISSAKEDPHHPRKAVIRAFKHRGAFVGATEGQSILLSRNSTPRANYSSVEELPYPDDQEEG